MAQQHMHLGVFAVGTGNHIAGWRHPGATTSSDDFSAFAAIAKTAEHAKLDMVFVADGVTCSTDDHPGFMAQLEPFTTLSALSVLTTHIGLIGTATTTFSEPYNLARLLSSLDHISNGRAGWNIVTSSSPKSEVNFGREAIDHNRRYEMAAEFVEVVKGLWDSWETDAMTANVATGQFVDPSKVHRLNHRGEFYDVEGPLNSSRCPQGQPVIVQAGSSSSGQAFAAKYAEVLFTVQQDVGVAREFYAGVKKRVADNDRQPNHCKILPGFLPVIGRTEEEAQAKLAVLASYVDERSALKTMSDRIGHDLSPYPLDGPIPDLPQTTQIEGYRRMMLTADFRSKHTLRDLYNVFAVSRGYYIACGTPEQVADTMEAWFKTQACDGFIVVPAHFPEALDDFVDLVVPVLQERGLFRREYTGSTLREHFGLPEPRNRYAC